MTIGLTNQRSLRPRLEWGGANVVWPIKRLALHLFLTATIEPMSSREIDEKARLRSMEQGLPVSLHVPIAARDVAAIQRFVGTTTTLSRQSGLETALLVQLHDPPTLDLSLPVWAIPGSAILHALAQVWVHVDFLGYRKAFVNALPKYDVSGLVLDHVMNRRIARLKGYSYTRIIPISRGANSSSGGPGEQMGVAYHSTPDMVRRNRELGTFIENADLADFVKMLDIKTGGKFQDPVNEAQRLVGGPLLPRS